MEKEILIWQDDFSGKELNRKDWSFETGYIRNNELQSYEDSSENAFIRNGQLVLRAIKTDDPKKPYTSASINTRHGQHFLYGRLEMRAKLPFGQGIWPAFWTLGTEKNTWPECGEIDIFELIGGNKVFPGGDGKICINVHTPETVKEKYGGMFELRNGRFCDDFHIFGINWTKKHLEFYVDNVIFSRWHIEDTPELHIPHFILLNIAVGGDWPGSPDDTTFFPQEYIVDWIRYYKNSKDD